MKSAYELAMERLEKERGPSRKLSDDQKASIAEIDKRFAARSAEAKLRADSEIAGAGTPEAAAERRAALAAELRSLEEKREQEKESVWQQA